MAEKEKSRVGLLSEFLEALKRLQTKKYFASFAPTYFSDVRWVRDNYPKLLREYLDNWIVVCREQVIFSHNSREEVDKFMADKGFSSKDVVIRFITDRRPIFRWDGKDFSLIE